MTTMVSVVIACRNAEATLGVQLAALARQECSVPWNVVLSDNGSTDRSVAVARSYAARLPGLVVVDSSARSGPGYARNIGARETKAPLLVFCDADDEAAAGWLQAMVTALTTDSFVAGRFEAGRLNDARALRSRSLPQNQTLQRSPFGPGLPHAGAGNLGIRRELFFSVGGFDPDVGCLEDTDLCWRVQLTGVPLVFCRAAMMHVRLRSSWRTMWRQGLDYGAASALLTDRYPARPASGGVSGPPVSRTPVKRTPDNRAATSRTLDSLAPAQARLGSAFGLVGRGFALLSAQRSVGGLLWTVGWHLGHRRWRPSPTPDVPLITSPRQQAN